MNAVPSRKRSPRQVAPLAAVAVGVLFFLSLELAVGHPDRWRLVSPWADEHVMSVARDVEREVIYAGVQGGGVMVREAGAWRLHPEVIPGGASPVNLALTPDGGLLAATTGGLYRSADGGRQWEAAVAGAHLLQVDLDEDGYGVAAGPGGVFRSADGGVHWEGVTMAGLPRGADPYRVLREPAGGLVLGTVGGAGIYRLAAGEARWQPDGMGLHGGARVFSLLILPDGALLAGTDGGAYGQERPGGPWTLTGQYWQTFRVLDLEWDPERDRLWVGGDEAAWSASLPAGGGFPEEWRVTETRDDFIAPVAWIDASADPVMATAGALYAWAPDRSRRPSMVASALLVAFGAWLILRSAFRRPGGGSPGR